MQEHIRTSPSGGFQIAADTRRRVPGRATETARSCGPAKTGSQLNPCSYAYGRDETPPMTTIRMMKETLSRRPSCCGDEECGRAVYIRLMAPQTPFEHDIDRIAVEIAQNCPLLDSNGLADCFSHVFELSAECRLFDRFCSAYQTRRDIKGPQTQG